jgi:putative ubiquitin-RnfH superfamily antitoxin RatB of RatAB toxin-antitoxin module
MTGATIAVTVAYAAPCVELLVAVTVPAGATVNDAIVQSDIVARYLLDPSQLEAAIFGQRVQRDTPLAHGDRIELTRPLLADPKRVRRKRAADQSGRKQGTPTATRKRRSL